MAPPTELGDGWATGRLEDAGMDPVPIRALLQRIEAGELGQLVLDGRTWNGQRVVAGEWIEAMTTAYVPFEPAGGYGLHWWTRVYSNGPHTAPRSTRSSPTTSCRPWMAPAGSSAPRRAILGLPTLARAAAAAGRRRRRRRRDTQPTGPCP